MYGSPHGKSAESISQLQAGDVRGRQPHLASLSYGQR